AAERDEPSGRLQHDRIADLLDEGRRRLSRTDRVHPNAVGPELVGEVTRERDDARLGRRVVGGAVDADALAGDRGDVHDVTAPAEASSVGSLRASTGTRRS